MCGIFGYIGAGTALQVVFDGLKMLEYRGYDSPGIARYLMKVLKSLRVQESYHHFYQKSTMVI